MTCMTRIVYTLYWISRINKNSQVIAHNINVLNSPGKTSHVFDTVVWSWIRNSNNSSRLTTGVIGGVTVHCLNPSQLNPSNHLCFCISLIPLRWFPNLSAGLSLNVKLIKRPCSWNINVSIVTQSVSIIFRFFQKYTDWKPYSNNIRFSTVSRYMTDLRLVNTFRLHFQLKLELDIVPRSLEPP